MVTDTLVTNLNYVQQGGECLLASYGVAAYPFTQQAIPDYFADYCRKFHIRTLNPLCAYLKHYPDEERRRKISGYQFIQFLHRTREHSFSRCRRKFSLTLIRDLKGRKAEIETELRSSALNAMMLSLNNPAHSMAVFGVSKGLVCYDTRPNTGLSPVIQSLSDIRCDLGEALLLRSL